MDQIELTGKKSGLDNCYMQVSPESFQREQQLHLIDLEPGTIIVLNAEAVSQQTTDTGACSVSCGENMSPPQKRGFTLEDLYCRRVSLNRLNACMLSQKMDLTSTVLEKSWHQIN